MRPSPRSRRPPSSASPWLPPWPVALLALACLSLAAVPMAGAQGDAQPDAAPAEFRNGQSTGFGSIAMLPYVPARGEPVEVEALIVIHDVATLERTSNLLVAFNRHSEDVRILHEELRAGDQVLQHTSEDVAEGGLQRQRFYSPADVLAEAEGGRVELRFNGTVSAAADGQWHVGVILIAFDGGWGTLRAADGSSAELYGFSLLMESGRPGGFLSPFHGQGNARLMILPMVAALAGTIAGGWQVVAAVRGRMRDPRPRPLAPLPPPVRAAQDSAPPPAPPPAPRPALPPAMPRRSVYEIATAAPATRAAAAPARPLATVRRGQDLWTMDFGYRLDPEVDGLDAEAAGEPSAREPSGAATPTGPIQGPHLPKGWELGPWTPTPMAEDEERRETTKGPAGKSTEESGEAEETQAEEQVAPVVKSRSAGQKRPPAKTAGGGGSSAKGRTGASPPRRPKARAEPGPRRMRSPSGGQPSR